MESLLLFSQRNGYTPVSDIVLREGMTTEIENAIVNSFTKFINECSRCGCDNIVAKAEMDVWEHFFNKSLLDYKGWGDIIISYINDCKNEWFRKLDIIEHLLIFLTNIVSKEKEAEMLVRLRNSINYEFERLNYGYRVLDNNRVMCICSKVDEKVLNDAIRLPQENIVYHLNKSIDKFRETPADYPNSIKEAISAVESICRIYTKKSTLGEALKELDKKNAIPKMFSEAMNKLYVYTNQKDVGVRHALVEDWIKSPTVDDAYFMLIVSCSFVNYINSKLINIQG